MVIAGLWLLVFVPARVRGDSAETKLKAAEKREPRQAIAKALPTDKQKRLALTALVSAAISALAFAASIALLVLAQSITPALFGLIASAPLAIGGLLLSAAARREAQRLAPRAVRRPAKHLGFEIETEAATEVEPTIRDRSWTPVNLPAPLANRPGELRQLAPVVSFETARADANANAQDGESIETFGSNSTSKPEIDVLDILRRRRAI